MARFKIFTVFSDKLKKMSPGQQSKASKNSVEWFKDRVGAVNKGKVSSRGDKWVVRPVTPVKVNPKAVNPSERSKEDIQKGLARNERNIAKNSTLDSNFKRAIKLDKKPLIGSLYFFTYDPKHKKTLKYYDVFPLVFPINYYDDGFLGLNLHYLRPFHRAKLMDMLYSIRKSIKVGGKEYEYLQISYAYLKSVAGTPYFKPTIHRYLYEHVRSPFARIMGARPDDYDDGELPIEWENAMTLPNEQFRKANKREVWADSAKIITR